MALLIIVTILFAVCACDPVPQFCIESLCVKRERERERARKLTKCHKVTVGPSLCFTGNIDVGELSKHRRRHHYKHKGENKNECF